MSGTSGEEVRRISSSGMVPQTSSLHTDADPGSEDTARTSLMSECSDKASTRSVQAVMNSIPRALAVWWQESVAAFFLVASTIASFATLYPYQGKPLPDWPYSITVGALLSFYSVVLRLAVSFLLAEGLAQLKWRWFTKKEKPLHDFVLHDNATRGPLGAIGLLQKLPLPRSWQWLACVLILLALFIGPFTQQVLQYTPCIVPVRTPGMNHASIPRSSVFWGRGKHAGAAVNSLNLTEQAAITAGLYTTGQVGATCPTANCSFAPYKSIGYCSSCQDISGNATIVVVNNTGDLPPFERSITANTSLPDGLFVTYLSSGQDLESDTSFNLAVSGNDPSPVPPCYDLEVLLGLPGSPTDPQTRGPPSGCTDPATNQTWRCQGFGAAGCSFHPCVRTYDGQVVNGTFTEKITDVTENSIWETNGPADLHSTLDKSCLTEEERQALTDAGIINGTDNWVPYAYINGSWNSAKYTSKPHLVEIEKQYVQRGCVYLMEFYFSMGLPIYMSQAFNGTFSVNTDGYGTWASFEGSQLLSLIYNFGDFSFQRTASLMDNISLSLTNYMRLNPLPDPLKDYYIRAPGLPATGQAEETKTCLNVRWAWLILPTSVAVLTAIFFVSVIFSSSKMPRHVRTWKHTALPLLFYGPYARESNILPLDQGTTQQDDTDMNTLAKELRVQLVQDSAGVVRLRGRDAETELT